MEVVVVERGGEIPAERHAAESLALSVGPVLVELDLDEVGHPEVDDAVLDILVGRPPRQVAHVQLPSGWRNLRDCPGYYPKATTPGPQI